MQTRLLWHRLSSWVRPQDPSEIAEALGALQRTRVLRHLTEAERRELAYAGHFRRFSPQEVIHYQGDPGLGLYLITRGVVELLVQTPVGMQDVATLGVGQFFGELTLFGPYRRLFTAVAAEEVHALCLFRPDLEALRSRQPALAAKLYAGLAEHLAAQLVLLLQGLQETQGTLSALQTLLRVWMDADAYGEGMDR
ncbi:MAG: cyclic nucleotide-binding domain-containing protein [Bacteroidota bacterium]|nr:cyclic nucleotide-binding domain-containing protein [Rhodothermia bacterium]MCS7155046.1 cyclic nucleotide-binding domain-containing protein [Bacteroidota bacterium]MDW8137943.1 cyclic nucleotide-binding domain-containing protein [Bacteroidota bacterium]MDW8286205.1 cyclic nucleotide-binding domain-containing protein [Bacteroidota bacterium]